MGVQGLDGVLEQLLFKSITKIEHDFIGIRFNSKSEEINFKINVILSKILEGKSELSTENEDLYGLIWCQELLVRLHELHDVIVWEDDLTITKLVFSLVHDQNGDKIHKLDGSVLVVVHLSAFDFDQFVADIGNDMKHDFILDHVLNHVIIVSFK